MCSIFKYKETVGRNFDYEVSYNEKLRVVNRGEFDNQYKILGMCTDIVQDYPLFYDGMNEYGLCMGGLAFQDTAKYYKPLFSKINIPSYDFILKTLGKFKTVQEFKEIVNSVNITDKAFSHEMPTSDLHWFMSDCKESIIIEQTESGLNYYDGDVMTNNPIYPLQKKEYDTFKDLIGNEEYVSNPNNTRGKETLGLEGAYTSDGRFERVSWLKENLDKSQNDFNSVSQSFHLLSSVEQIYGTTHVEDKFEYTIYSVVYDLKNQKVYVKGYDNINIDVFSF